MSIIRVGCRTIARDVDSLHDSIAEVPMVMVDAGVRHGNPLAAAVQSRDECRLRYVDAHVGPDFVIECGESWGGSEERALRMQGDA